MSENVYAVLPTKADFRLKGCRLSIIKGNKSETW